MSDGTVDALNRIADAMNRVADAIAGSKRAAAPAPPAAPSDQKCNKCGSALETFVAKSGATYLRCIAQRKAYKEGKQEDGHFLMKI